ncbi:ATP-binding protein [Streptacidiphilus sp. N1-10]|uniref:histidine kinase n=1 Tax=Streptacidiphilus jeojiensis TaxID=3229225 RepID=A0ABV6XGT9_9ACTN
MDEEIPRSGCAAQPDPYPGEVLLRGNSWVRRHPWRADTALALLLFALSLDEVPRGPAGTALALICVNALIAATVIPRRRFPVAAFATAAAFGALQITLGQQPGSIPPVPALQPSMTDLAIPVLLYTLAAHRPRRISVAGLTVCLIGAAVAVSQWAPAHRAYPGIPLLAAAVALGGSALVAWVLGDSVAYRHRRIQYASLQERAARLEAERDAQARIAAAAERARELQEKRARVVDESAARLRRIERDLHDGAQVRLTALAMSLGEIKENLEQDLDGEHTLALLGAAHRNAKETLAELRDLARGIHPAVLDRGLAAALSLLAETSPIPVDLTVGAGVGLGVGAGERPSPAIEAIAYFCAAELVANAAKHSGAARITIDVHEQEGRLLMTVTDDGNGGARPDPARGSGLAGLRERVQSVDGRLDVTSPPGGPTAVAVELPRHA